MSIPGVIKSDFYIIKGSWKSKELLYRYMTEAYFPDMETFEKSFFDPGYQARLAKSLEKIADPLFLISEAIQRLYGVFPIRTLRHHRYSL